MDMIFPSNIKCVYCKVPIKSTNTYSLCKDCFQQIRFHIEDEHICTFYEGVMIKLIHRFKYSAATYLADIFAQMINQKLKSIDKTADLLVSIPSSTNRLRYRGYNQSALLCDSLSRLCGIPHQPILERAKETAPLASLDPLERAMELSGAFRLKENLPDIKGKKILIIDDIFTTGVTIGEAISCMESSCNDIRADYMVLSSKKIY